MKEKYFQVKIFLVLVFVLFFMYSHKLSYVALTTKFKNANDDHKFRVSFSIFQLRQHNVSLNNDHLSRTAAVVGGRFSKTRTFCSQFVNKLVPT
jgi:hypothetical protein